MHVDLVVIGLVLVLGCAAFFFGVVYVLCRFLGAVGRGMLTMFGVKTRVSGDYPPLSRRGRLICPQERCRKTEHRAARFCSQCGARLLARGRD